MNPRARGTRYVGSCLAATLVLLPIVACGGQSYKASLAEDHDATLVPEESQNLESPLYGLHSSRGWRELPIVFRIGKALNDSQQQAILRAVETWEQAVGQQLFVYEGRDSVTGDDFPDLASSLADDVNGQYLNARWDKTGKSALTLATTVWAAAEDDPNVITHADIHFNNESYVLGDAHTLVYDAENGREVVDLETLALHELGHLLGLSHVEPAVDPQSIMNPSIYIGEGMASPYVSCPDIVRIQSIYGCKGEACDRDLICQRLNTRRSPQPEQNDL